MNVLQPTEGEPGWRWTPETAELVALAIESAVTYCVILSPDRDDITTAVLDTLADANLLVPPTTRRELSTVPGPSNLDLDPIYARRAEYEHRRFAGSPYQLLPFADACASDVLPLVEEVVALRAQVNHFTHKASHTEGQAEQQTTEDRPSVWLELYDVERAALAALDANGHSYTAAALSWALQNRDDVMQLSVARLDRAHLSGARAAVDRLAAALAERQATGT